MLTVSSYIKNRCSDSHICLGEFCRKFIENKVIEFDL